MKDQQMLKDFNEKFGFPIRTTPQVPSDEEVRQRCRLKVEEVFEMLIDALDRKNETHELKFLHDRIMGLINRSAVRVNMVGVIDALADESYLLLGDAISFGVDMAPVLKLVHETNMQKLPATTQGGKPIKPPGWKPPDIRSELIRQGWKP